MEGRWEKAKTSLERAWVFGFLRMRNEEKETVKSGISWIYCWEKAIISPVGSLCNRTDRREERINFHSFKHKENIKIKRKEYRFDLRKKADPAMILKQSSAYFWENPSEKSHKNGRNIYAGPASNKERIKIISSLHGFCRSIGRIRRGNLFQNRAVKIKWKGISPVTALQASGHPPA